VLELKAVPEAPSFARRHARRVLGGWGMPGELVADAEMLVSELVTNALRATLLLEEASLDAGALGGPYPMTLRLLASSRRLVIEAWDCHPGDPVPAGPSDQAEAGRGLAIVAAYANRWGSRRLSRHVKAVWAELLLPSAPHESGN
jgi:anti-sigma regulatory factor (Ser/Thr protein kinase)